MERPLWDCVQEIYYSTLPMPRSERSAFIASACGHDSTLLREVNSLVAADDASDGFLESPVFKLGLKLIASDGANRRERISASLDNLIGTMIDERYLVEKELGQGGMGKVYLARDVTLHSRAVVIKVLLEASLQDPYVVKKFRQEVEALARIDHPHVVSVLGAGTLSDGKLYIVMQYVSGKTLRSEIPTEGMNLERAALILQQIGAALDDVHEKRIYHRDLKPENIMLQIHKSGRESVKVVDFGIAKVRDSVIAPSTANDVRIGTLLYMSPEQLRGGHRITAASDIYSMAVIAYEMVTGRRPFNPSSGPQLLEMHREGVPVRPVDLRASLSTETQAIILRGLSFEPAARHQSAGEFGEALASSLLNEGETGRASKRAGLLAEPAPQDSFARPVIQPSAQVLNRRRMNWRKPEFAAIAFFVLLLIGAAAVFLNQRKTAEPLNEVTPSTRSFTYSLTVQRIRDNKPYQDPFQSTGQEIFESGDKFRLNVLSSHPGYLYLFNEGPPEPNGSSFTLIYPTPETNSGSASLGADQYVRTNWNTFKGQPGTENFWIVWSASPISQLESAKTEAFKRQNFALTNESLNLVKTFLITAQNEAKTRYATDKGNQQVTVRGAADVLVRMLQFKHR
jgi:serine/threonine protein kinase